MARVGGENSDLCVIGSEYCNNRVVELEVVRKVKVPKPDSTMFVGDLKKNIVFKIDETTSSFPGVHKKRVLRDRHGSPILTFRHKIRSLHSRWRVYKGDSEDKKDLIFTAKQSSIMRSNKELHVFLANNKDEKTCDFRVGTSSDTFYLGDSPTHVIAEMSDCTVRVYPNADQAFIISLIVILDGMYQRGGRKGDMANLVLEGFILGAQIALA